MGSHRYKAWNGPMPTTAAQQSVATGTSIKTMLQIATPSSRQITLISWGFSMSVAELGTVELLETDVAATVTAHVAAGVQPLVPGVPASLMTLSTSATGYTASAEGSITTTREFDSQQIAGTAGDNELNYDYQFMPDERPVIAVSKFLRVRASFLSTGTNFQCYVCWEE
jgi:hypothetical protein